MLGGNGDGVHLFRGVGEYEEMIGLWLIFSFGILAIFGLGFLLGYMESRWRR